MGIKLIKDETLRSIAEAIREKKSITDYITPNAMAAAIASIAAGGGDSGGGLINGYKFACGTESYASDQGQATGVDIEHEDVGNPIAVFVWVNDPPIIGDDGSQLRYRFGGYWLNVINSPKDNTENIEKSLAGITCSGAMVAVNSSTSVSAGANAARFRIGIKSNTTFNIGCDSTYPLRGGLVYNWLIIGGG